MAKRLDGKVAIVTGGANGIGASTVFLFHEHGAKVVIADIQDNLGQKIADKLGENFSYVHCDVTNEDDICNLIDTTVAKHGQLDLMYEDDICNLIDTTVAKHGQLDLMYNNAGIMDSGSPFGRILDAKKSDLERVIRVNLVGSFLGAKHAARVMVPQRKGCILFTSSAATAIAGMSSHAYAASKYAILGVAKGLAAELGQYGIRVNCASQFAVLGTGISGERSEADASKAELVISNHVGNLKGKILKAEDVPRAALYLASDEANYISGLNLLVDGGYSVVNPNMMNF